MGSASNSDHELLQIMLQRAVQTVDWTYSLFWQLCPQRRILVWGEGYYNGAIKTRKTVQPMELEGSGAHEEAASLERSQQLRELYETLSAGETNQSPPAIRRPSAALSPEDLTESEWFYLMCISFSFPPGLGLPGRAYAKREHLWLTGANEVDSKVFTRAILAKSAGIQTVICIPFLDGVVELGTVEKVEEDIGLVQEITTIFSTNNDEDDDELLHVPKPALSEHSISNYNNNSGANQQGKTNNSCSRQPLRLPITPTTTSDSLINIRSVENNHLPVDIEEEEDVAEEEEEEDDSAEMEVEPNELIQLDDMSEDIRVGSREDGSSHLDSPPYHQVVPGNCQTAVAADHLSRSDSAHKWPGIEDQPPPPPSDGGIGIQRVELPLESSSGRDDEYAKDGEGETSDRYSQTVSTILQHQSTRCSETFSNVISYYVTLLSAHSAFYNWLPTSHRRRLLRGSSQSQRSLKYILFSVPLIHAKSDHCDETSPVLLPKSREATSDYVSSRLRRAAPQEELSANHVLAERRRREKLNERFITLRSLVPFVTKMDKASILGDTIEYVKQLKEKIQDLENQNKKSRISGEPKRSNGVKEHTNAGRLRKMRMLEDIGGGGREGQPLVGGIGLLQVEVSIIESDALVELQCPHREGLLLDVMQMLRELKVEIKAVQSSVHDGIFAAELKAQVKEKSNGKKATIMEVKRAIHQIIPIRVTRQRRT